MTFDEALSAARSVGETGSIDAAATATAWMVANLGEIQPCGFEPPCTDQPGIVAILDGGGDPMYEFTPGEARWYAAELLRAADKAEAQRSSP